jgi:hypothetical protein
MIDDAAARAETLLDRLESAIRLLEAQPEAATLLSSLTVFDPHVRFSFSGEGHSLRSTPIESNFSLDARALA